MFVKKLIFPLFLIALFIGASNTSYSQVSNTIDPVTGIAISNGEKIYDADGYDQYGYNRSGYNRYGYDNQGFDKSGYDKSGNVRNTEYINRDKKNSSTTDPQNNGQDNGQNNGQDNGNEKNKTKENK